MRTLLALLAAAGLLSGCYETEQRVIQRGQDVGIAAGSWRCLNANEKNGGRIVLSEPNRTAGDDVVYRAVVDRSGYVVRMEKSGALVIVETDEYGSIAHTFVRPEADGSFSLLVPEDRPALEALARQHGIELSFNRLGPPKPRGSPDRILAFLRAHTGAELKKTSTCRKAA